MRAADLAPVLGYEHGSCGDEEYPLAGGGSSPSRTSATTSAASAPGGSPQDVFTCGSACPVVDPCPDLPTAGAPLPTICRTVHEFGVNLPGPPASTPGGAPLAPDQCAPASSFAPLP